METDKKTSLKYYLWLLLSFIFCVLTGCSGITEDKVHGHHAITALMDNAELIMNDDPEYALRLMDSIDSHSIQGRALQARYALLYTEAQYKNYIDESNDSLIMIAVRYYSGRKDYLSRFRSYYDLGCIYNENGQYTDAAIALSEAEILTDKINDKYRVGLLYSQLGDVYIKSFDYRRAKQYFSDAAECYLNAGKEEHRVYAQYEVACCLIDLHTFNEADSIMKDIQEWTIKNDTDLYAKVLLNRLTCLLYGNEIDSCVSVFNHYISTFGESDDDWQILSLFALYNIKLKNYSSGLKYLEKAWSCPLSEVDSVSLSYLSSMLAENRGQYEDALINYKRYTYSQNDQLKELLRQPILGAQKEHFQTLVELEMLKNRHNKTILVLCVVIFVLVLTMMIIHHYYQKKRIEERLYDSLAAVKELTTSNRIHVDKISRLKDEVLKQLYGRQEMSNRLYSMYFDSENQEKITKQQLITTINSLIKTYTSLEYTNSLDNLLNESCNDIMKRLSMPEIGLNEKELQLLRFSLAGLSLKSVSVILKESAHNVYQIKSRLMKKIRTISYELWSDVDRLL